MRPQKSDGNHELKVIRDYAHHPALNGKYVGGVDPNRERMLLSPYVDDTKTLHFEMMGYNRSKLFALKFLRDINVCLNKSSSVGSEIHIAFVKRSVIIAVIFKLHF